MEQIQAALKQPHKAKAYHKAWQAIKVPFISSANLYLELHPVVLAFSLELS
jgi:hypothetical protein